MAAKVDVSVVVPCLNEEANLPPLASRLFAAMARAGVSCELVPVDDGSTDTTWDVIQTLSRAHPDAITGVRHDTNLGIPAAWRSGIAAARGTYVCLIDADLQNPPEQVVTLYRRLLESRADICQGVRSQIEREKDGRLAFSKGLNTVLNVAFGDRAADSKSGFVLGPRRVMADVVDYRGDYQVFQAFIRVAARAKGYTMVEVETLFLPRNAGESFLAGSRAWKVSAATLTDFPTALREFGRGRREPIDGTLAPRSRPVPRAGTPYRGWRRALFEAYFASAPIHHRLARRRVRSLYLELRETQWLPRQELADLQLRKLQRLVQHAAVHVPYYREALAGIGPDPIAGLEDLRRLPQLTKDDIRERLYFDLFADTHRTRDMVKMTTSGATGEPLVTYVDRYQLEVRLAVALRAAEWSGWRFGDRQLRISDDSVGMTNWQRMRAGLDNLLLRRDEFTTAEVDDEGLATILDSLEQGPPSLIDGSGGTLDQIATRAAAHPDRYRARGIISRAADISAETRELAGKALQAPVHDSYGTREIGDIAFGCEAMDAGEVHHVMDESVIVEILVDGRPAEPGETGEIVVTDLNNFSVPLIRYRVGDLATAVDESRPCSCGRGLSRIGRIEGRTQASVQLADGSWLPASFFAHFFQDYDFLVRQFQVSQDQPGQLLLQIVKGPQWSLVAEAEVLTELGGIVSGTPIAVLHVDAIPLERPGDDHNLRPGTQP